jgi:hypothetical protein
MNFSFNRAQVVPLSKMPAKVLVRWQATLPAAEVNDFEYHVERSIADGNFERIARPIPATEDSWYVDYAAELRGLAPRIRYRVTARKISTQEEIASPVMSLTGDLDLVGLYIVDEENFRLQDTAGTPCLVYSRRRGGIPCGRCFDPVQKKRTISNCKTCYGTNWEGGYYKPVEAWIDFNASSKDLAQSQWGETQENTSPIQLSNFPILMTGDVIREMRDARMWRVGPVRETQRHRVPMTQVAQVQEIHPKDPEYSIPVDEMKLLERVEELERLRRRREF